MPITMPPPGGDQETVVASADPRLGLTSGTVVASTVYVVRMPRIERPFTVTGIRCFIGASVAGNIAAALMTSADGDVFDRVANGPEVAIGATGAWQTIALAASYVYQPATDLWVAIGADAAAGIGRFSTLSTAAVERGYAVLLASAYASGIPASINASGGSSLAPCVLLV